MALRKPAVLGVLAHPDDECIFGWPVFQNETIDRHLIIVASDRHNPEREWCQHRGEALAEVCRDCGIDYRLLDFDSEFYRLPYRRAERVFKDLYAGVRQAIRDAFERAPIDTVFCHNPHGEYGMLDHRLVFDMVFNAPEVPTVCVTDIAEVHPDWPSSNEVPAALYESFYRGRPHTPVDLRATFYRHCKAVYEAHGVWTWTHREPPDYPPPSCDLYVLRADDRFDTEAFLSRL